MSNDKPAATYYPLAEVHTLEATGGKYSASWWKDTADRVISTTAQAAIATLTAASIPGLLDIDPLAVASVAALGGLLAFLKALAVTRTPG